MRSLSNRSNFGFGTFVDKPIAPFMDPSKYRYSCDFIIIIINILKIMYEL